MGASKGWCWWRKRFLNERVRVSLKSQDFRVEIILIIIAIDIFTRFVIRTRYGPGDLVHNFSHNPHTRLRLSHLGVGGAAGSSGQKPGVLLSTLQCTGNPLPAENDLAPNVILADIEKPPWKDLVNRRHLSTSEFLFKREFSENKHSGWGLVRCWCTVLSFLSVPVSGIQEAEGERRTREKGKSLRLTLKE